VINKIDKITFETSIIAGSVGIVGDKVGKALETQFSCPVGVVVDKNRNIYVTDFSNSKIKKISPDGEVTVFAGSVNGYEDGKGTSSKFYSPIGMCISGND